MKTEPTHIDIRTELTCEMDTAIVDELKIGVHGVDSKAMNILFAKLRTLILIDIREISNQIKPDQRKKKCTN